MMRKIIGLILCGALLLGCWMSASAAAGDDRLAFRADGTFTILQLTDTQDDHYPAYDMVNLVTRAVRECKPDLVVFTGDIVEDSRAGDVGVDGENGREGVTVKDSKGTIDREKTLANVRVAVDAVFSILEDAEVPYVITQGNNDHKCGIEPADWLEIYAAYPHCLTVDASDDAQGRIDQNVLIYGSDGAPKFNLWLMDTGRAQVTEEQIDWFKSASARLTAENGGTPIPAMVFQHIQVAEVGNLFEPCKPWDQGAKVKDGRFYRLNREIAVGKSFYAYVPGESSAQFAAWKDAGDVIGAFFGHQHVDGFSGTYDGIELGLTYGAEFSKIGPYGYRVLTLHEDDILHYDNAQYVYEGTVKNGTDTITLQPDMPESNTGIGLVSLFEKLLKLFEQILAVMESVFIAKG